MGVGSAVVRAVVTRVPSIPMRLVMRCRAAAPRHCREGLERKRKQHAKQHETSQLVHAAILAGALRQINRLHDAPAMLSGPFHTPPSAA
jgi:hypothetical protein